MSLDRLIPCCDFGQLSNNFKTSHFTNDNSLFFRLSPEYLSLTTPLGNCLQFGSQFFEHYLSSSFAIVRLSRCGDVRGRPVASSHFSPGFAPQVGQRTDSALSLFATCK